MRDATAGITINGKHSFRDFSALLHKAVRDYPEWYDPTETPPYSSKEYSFGELFGDRVYQYRDIEYIFKFALQDERLNELSIIAFIDFIYGLRGQFSIYDDFMTDYHFVGKVAKVQRIDTVGEADGAHMVSVTFHCEAFRKANFNPAYPVDENLWPDVDGDGSITSNDSSLIKSAATEIGVGHPSGLTPEQEVRADADRDGAITTNDASLVDAFNTEAGAGHYKNSPAGWTAFLNDYQNRMPEVI